MVLIDVLKKKQNSLEKKLFSFLKQLPEHECLCVVENER